MVKWLTAPQYAKETGLSYHQVLCLCRSDKLTAIITEGGQWRIKVSETPSNAIEIEKTLEENKRLKFKLEQIQQLIES